MLLPRLPRGHPLDCHVFLSESPDWAAGATGGTPLWVASDVALAEAGVKREFDYVYHPSPAVQNNGSVWVHAVFTPLGASPDPKGGCEGV